jgi:hypothetical protein
MMTQHQGTITHTAAVVATIAIFASILLSQTKTDSARPQSERAVAQSVAPTSGRYQMVISPTIRADTFLLGTQTGKIWQRIKFNDLEGEPEVWEAQTRLDSAQEKANWIAQQILKNK